MENGGMVAYVLPTQNLHSDYNGHAFSSFIFFFSSSSSSFGPTFELLKTFYKPPFFELHTIVNCFVRCDMGVHVTSYSDSGFLSSFPFSFSFIFPFLFPLFQN